MSFFDTFYWRICISKGTLFMAVYIDTLLSTTIDALLRVTDGQLCYNEIAFEYDFFCPITNSRVLHRYPLSLAAIWKVYYHSIRCLLSACWTLGFCFLRLFSMAYWAVALPLSSELPALRSLAASLDLEI
jgi:hypothetical protein